MKKKTFVFLIVFVVSGMICTTLLYSFQTVSRYHVELHYNYFENMGYTDKNQYIRMPIEIMLTKFQIDSVNQIATIDMLVQPIQNKDPKQIVKLSATPNSVHTILNHKLYIEQYAYNRKYDRLIISLIVEQKRYQMWVENLGKHDSFI